MFRSIPDSKAMYRISRNKQLHRTLKNCGVSTVAHKWWSNYYFIRTHYGMKLFSFIWSSKTGWNVFKRNVTDLSPSVFVENELWGLKQVVAFVKYVSSENSNC